MRRVRLLDVHCGRCGQAAAGDADHQLRQPELRGPAGARGAHAPRESRHGRRVRDRREDRGRTDFILNQEPYRRAKILVAGANFGCGSAREQAAWAVRDFGLRALIAPSFGGSSARTASGTASSPPRWPLLVRGLDGEVAAFQARDRKLQPWVYETVEVAAGDAGSLTAHRSEEG